MCFFLPFWGCWCRCRERNGGSGFGRLHCETRGSRANRSTGGCWSHCWRMYGAVRPERCGKWLCSPVWLDLLFKLKLSQGPAIHFRVSSKSGDGIGWEEALHRGASPQKQTAWVNCNQDYRWEVDWDWISDYSYSWEKSEHIGTVDWCWTQLSSFKTFLERGGGV